jgi:hypothetical protein
VELRESERRRKVAALLVGSMHNTMSDHMRRHPDEIREHFVSLELGIGWSNTVLHALAGDFEYVKSTIPAGHDLLVQIEIVLGE